VFCFLRTLAKTTKERKKQQKETMNGQEKKSVFLEMCPAKLKVKN